MATRWETSTRLPHGCTRGSGEGIVWAAFDFTGGTFQNFFFFFFWNVTAQQYLHLPAEDISVNSKTWKPQTFSQFCFSGVKKNRERGGEKCCFTDWIRFEPKFMLFLELTTSSPLVSCLFIRNGRFLIGPPVPVTAHFLNFEVEIMCWTALWSTCF